MSFFVELKRRNVYRVGIAYVLMGWVLLQAADFALDLVEAPNWVLQVFVIAVIIGLPIALFFAWAFEMTPEGIKREHEVDRSQSITPQTGRKLDRAIIVFLGVALVLVLAERFFLAGDQAENGVEPTQVAKSIAVLPFADMSQAKDQEWFADGLAEEILNALVKTPDLQVASRTSSMQYKGSEKDISTIAQELGVAHVLEGSVRSATDRIRVTAQLIRASDGFHLWSESYDRDVADMIGIQEDLATNIAMALETTMDPEALAQMADVGTESIEAYQAYLQGVSLQAASLSEVGASEVTQRAYEKFEEARSIDPQFADAHVRAANYWKVELTPARTDNGSSNLQPLQMLLEYQKRIGLAIQTAKTDGDRMRSLADRAAVDLRLNEARRLFQEYLELRPNDEQARFELMGIVVAMDDKATARAILEHWKSKGETDVYSANFYINEAYRIVDPSEAADFGLQALRRWPSSIHVLYQTHRTLVWAGRYEEASRLAAQYETLVPGNNPLILAREACVAGDRAAAEKILANLDPQDLDVIWLVHNMLGNTHEEIETLRPVEESGVLFQLASFMHYTKFDPRPYPALMKILEREGITRPSPAVPPFRCPPASP